MEIRLNKTDRKRTIDYTFKNSPVIKCESEETNKSQEFANLLKSINFPNVLNFDEDMNSDSTPNSWQDNSLKSKLIDEVKNGSLLEENTYSNDIKITYEKPLTPEFGQRNQDQRKRPLLRLSKA